MKEGLRKGERRKKPPSTNLWSEEGNTGCKQRDKSRRLLYIKQEMALGTRPVLMGVVKMIKIKHSMKTEQ